MNKILDRVRFSSVWFIQQVVVLLFSLLIFVTRLLSVSTLDVLHCARRQPLQPDPIPVPGSNASSGVHLIAGRRRRGRARAAHPLMTQCQPTPMAPDAALGSRLSECLFSDSPRQRDTSGQDPFAVVAAAAAAVFRCSLFELFAQPLQKRRQNELSSVAKWRRRQTAKTAGDSQTARLCLQLQLHQRVELKCSKMTKLISRRSRRRPRVLGYQWQRMQQAGRQTTTTRSPLIDMAKWPSMLPMELELRMWLWLWLQLEQAPRHVSCRCRQRVRGNA